MTRKVLVIGLDCAAPDLVFDQLANVMPNLTRLRKEGVYGRMRSSDPPITCPAWAVMSTSRTPGQLGMYGFRHREGFSYTKFSIATAYDVKEPAVWDILSNQGKYVCIVGVPPSYPPPNLNGVSISGFLAPSTESEYASPSSVKTELEGLGGYILDVMNFRTDDKDRLLKDLFELTENRFKVVTHLMKTKPWDFFMFVEMGPDRLHHGFWKFYDKAHHAYESGNKFESVFADYYRFLDEKIGEILNLIDDDTIVLVVSDHGAKPMKGVICINEWLQREGYLKLRTQPTEQVRLAQADIDWGKTIAWGWGGYYARIFFNVKGREEKGVIDPKDFEKVRRELAEKLRKLPGINGEVLDTKISTPEELYNGVVNGDSPDLMVHFDNLSYRSAGTLGHSGVYLSENDTGPDDAVHDWDGIFIIWDPKHKIGRELQGLRIYDVAPTILHAMGMKVPKAMEGNIIKVE
jgi:predicted AlkP superfamily phosphohydrolase/phosphomutase